MPFAVFSVFSFASSFASSLVSSFLVSFFSESTSFLVSSASFACSAVVSVTVAADTPTVLLNATVELRPRTRSFLTILFFIKSYLLFRFNKNI